MAKVIYRCEFKLNDYRKLDLHVYSKNGIGDFMHGFWINDDLEFTKGEDAKAWIPPSCIKYISKDTVN